MRSYSKLFIVSFPMLLRDVQDNATHPEIKSIVEKSF